MTKLAPCALAQHRAPLTPRQLRWFSRFDLLVTHDPLPRAQVDALHARGTKLLVYEWSVAFYGSFADAWQRGLLQRHPEALLNRGGLRGGAGSAEADAWYYESANEERRVERARAIARLLDDIGYDGVFFDTTIEESVHPAALAEFKSRHSGAGYDREFARFLASLRRELGGKVIFTTQGYRKADDYLPYADWDLTQSLITWKGGVSRPWDDARDPSNSIHYLFVNVIEPARVRGIRASASRVSTTAVPASSRSSSRATRLDEAQVEEWKSAASRNDEAVDSRRTTGSEAVDGCAGTLVVRAAARIMAGVDGERCGRAGLQRDVGVGDGGDDGGARLALRVLARRHDVGDFVEKDAWRYAQHLHLDQRAGAGDAQQVGGRRRRGRRATTAR